MQRNRIPKVVIFALAASVLLSVLALECAWGSLVVRRPSAFAANKAVVLTFDDGPDPAVTPRVVEILEEHRVPAVFFVTGNRLERFGERVRYPAGLAVLGSHSYTHRRMLTSSTLSQTRDLQAGAHALDKYAANASCIYRPPRGQVRATTVARMRMRGYRLLGWSAAYDRHVDHLHAPTRVDRFLDSIRPGDVILMHDSGPNAETMLADLPHILAGLKRKGYEFALP